MSICSAEYLLNKCSNGYIPTNDEALLLYRVAPLTLLMHTAHRIRDRIHPNNYVTWIIDRNINLTNVCRVHCRFCNFCVSLNSRNAYLLSYDEYYEKIDALFKAGGNQILLQGGIHPELSLDYYCELFRHLKMRYPRLKLHALGPPEVIDLANKSQLSISDTLEILTDAGLDSLPGAGAEILSDRVRGILSPSKCSVDQWLDVMRQAHRLNIVTTATMMFGHIETDTERIEHLMHLHQLQNEKPQSSQGFVSFIPWPFAINNTRLIKSHPGISPVSASDYLRLLAISRIILQNIPHIQASWLTVGTQTASLSLFAGADDLGSVMMEEKVVSAAGVTHTLSSAQMIELIETNGFTAVKRDQNFNLLT